MTSARSAVVVLLFSGLLPLASATGDSAPRGSVVQSSVAVNASDWKAQNSYSFRELNLKSKVEDSGRGRLEQSKTFEVMMIDGSPYKRLIAIDYEPLLGAQAHAEQSKLEREIAHRRNESYASRQARISKYTSDRAEEYSLMQQMIAAFQFKFLKQQQVEGVECYEFDAMPNPDYRPPVEKARVLQGMRGKIWIDAHRFHWVKVEAEVTEPVAFGFFIAKVKPGTTFELDQAPVGDVWLPKRFVQTVNASLFGVYGYRAKEEQRFSDYAEENPLARVNPHVN